MDTNSGGNSSALARTARAVSALCMVVLTAGCAEQTSSDATAPGSPMSPVPATPASSQSIKASSWTDEFDEEQLERYDEALTRWQEYSRKTAVIYRKGLDTPAAREVFREYDLQAVARIRSLSETYEAQGVRTVRGPEPLSTQAISIARTVVRISQCSDYSRVLVTRDGERVQGVKPRHAVTPLLIEMDRVAGGDWMVARVQLKDRTSCAG